MVTAIFSLLVVSLFGWYAIRPTVQTILFLRREIADKTTLNQKMEDKITNLIEAQAAYEAVADKLPFVDQALPETPEAVELASQISTLAQQNGASVSAIQIATVPLSSDATPSGKITKAAGEETFATTVVLEGPWTSVYYFLDGLVKLRRLTTIDTISLKSGSTFSGGTPTLNLVVKLTSYYGR